NVVGGKDSRDGKGQALRIKLPQGAAGCSDDTTCANWKPHLGAKLDSLYYSYWVKFPENFDFVRGGKLPGIGSFEPRTGGDKPNGNDGWSVRVMWEKAGRLGQYVYHPDQPQAFGEFFPWDAPLPEKGKWYQVKTLVRLNTPGKHDGVITTWLNGKQVFDKRDLRFRNGNNLQIERFLFTVFFGGTGAEWAPPRDMLVYLDDFTLSPEAH
ncbi:MAG: polysaccharide lyase, partial [Thiothrix sp.]